MKNTVGPPWQSLVGKGTINGSPVHPFHRRSMANPSKKFLERLLSNPEKRVWVTLVCTIFLSYLTIIFFLSHLYIFFPQRAADICIAANDERRFTISCCNG